MLCALELIDLLLVCACCCAEHLSSLSMKAVTLETLKMIEPRTRPESGVALFGDAG